jgi:hypothetical protein
LHRTKPLKQVLVRGQTFSLFSQMTTPSSAAGPAETVPTAIVVGIAGSPIVPRAVSRNRRNAFCSASAGLPRLCLARHLLAVLVLLLYRRALYCSCGLSLSALRCLLLSRGGRHGAVLLLWSLVGTALTVVSSGAAQVQFVIGDQDPLVKATKKGDCTGLISIYCPIACSNSVSPRCACASSQRFSHCWRRYTICCFSPSLLTKCCATVSSARTASLCQCQGQERIDPDLPHRYVASQSLCLCAAKSSLSACRSYLAESACTGAVSLCSLAWASGGAANPSQAWR